MTGRVVRARDLKPGDRFFTRGDWRTEPGIWEVLEQEPDVGRTRCRPITHPDEGESLFSSTAYVTKGTRP